MPTTRAAAIVRRHLLACALALPPGCAPDIDGMDAGIDAGADAGGAACDKSAFADPEGNGLRASEAALEVDPDNYAGCGFCLLSVAPFGCGGPDSSCTPCRDDDDCTDPADDPCVSPGSDPYIVSFDLDDETIDGDLPKTSVTWTESGGAPGRCAGFTLAVEGIIVCPLCFAVPPDDLAVQYDDGVNVSNAVCVDVSGA